MGDGQPVSLTIRGMQWEGDGKPEVVEWDTEGRLYRKESAWYLLYKESERTGLEGTTTMIRVDRDQTVSLIRTGTTRMKLTFVEGCRQETRMELPYGMMAMGIFTHIVRSELSETRGGIHLEYSLEFDEAGTTNFQLDVTFHAIVAEGTEIPASVG